MAPTSSEAPARASRIIAAEALAGVEPVDLQSLADAPPQERRVPTPRELAGDGGRAAYGLGWQRGWAQGDRHGRAQERLAVAQAQVAAAGAIADETGARMRQLVDGFAQQLAALEARVADEVVTLAIDIARQVLRREPGIDPAGLLPAAREALRTLGDEAGTLDVHLHPADAQRLAAAFEAAEGTRCRVVPDAQLAIGACRVETAGGLADAGLQRRWSDVLARLGMDPGDAP